MTGLQNATYVLADLWANDEAVRESLGIHKVYMHSGFSLQDSLVALFVIFELLEEMCGTTFKLMYLKYSDAYIRVSAFVN